MEKSNAIFRLHDLIQTIYDRTTFGQSTNYKSIIADILDIDKDDIVSILRFTSSFIQLHTEVIDIVKTNPLLSSEKNLNFINKLEIAISKISVDKDIDAYTRHIDSNTILALDYMAEHLALLEKHEKMELQEEEINMFISEIENISSRLNESNLPFELKELVKNNLKVLKDSFLLYQVSGLDGVQSALEQIIGSVCLNQAAFENDSQSPEISGFMGMVRKLVEVVQAGNAVGQFLDYINKYLPPE
ncbi:hypothetical protein P8859_05935 [Bacillus spizizenii]|nr:hypothetical protein [Bacillus spizizenii]MCY8255342.1 hypothetical protein [Bacillus spizizenii]MCY8315090.1 hypothetical protein [Bacillus spizizenii]MCY8415499.1 hypothetical protein [Bacillus spizizenii]MCY9334298.1 hypothetical protein [Bacillus spizizenii]